MAKGDDCVLSKQLLFDKYKIITFSIIPEIILFKIFKFCPTVSPSI